MVRSASPHTLLGSWTSVYAPRHKHQPGNALSLCHAQLADRSRLGTLRLPVALANGTRPASSIVASIPVSTVSTSRVLLGFGFGCSLRCWRHGAVHASVASHRTHASGAMALPPRGMQWQVGKILPQYGVSAADDCTRGSVGQHI